MENKGKRVMGIDLGRSDPSCVCTVKVEKDRIIVDDLKHIEPSKEIYLKLKRLITSGNIEFRSDNIDLIKELEEFIKSCDRKEILPENMINWSIPDGSDECCFKMAKAIFDKIEKMELTEHKVLSELKEEFGVE
jgi:hypothetical protein